MDLSLVIPVFLAGLLTFFAPCTFPLLPAYLSFIGGVSLNEIKENPSLSVRRKVFINALLYVLGFSFVFVVLGSLFGLGGGTLFRYRAILSSAGGFVVLLFGLFIVFQPQAKSFGFLYRDGRLGIFKYLKPGKPISSFLFGAAFAFGWTPCVGPVLGAVLTLAATGSTVVYGVTLLAIFSLGLAVPFLVVASSSAWALERIKNANKFLRITSLLGGMLLVVLGLLLISGHIEIWTNYFYKVFPVPSNVFLKYY
ncbi:MAG: sulfite exporter TauE/SafE family protein [Candidatus Doudnabacteria bacterium]|nr:sulfite exporter TauE/SafE family protein [Candidatus Doudnabacteria bacterium]